MKRTSIYLSDKIKAVIRPNEENLSGRLSSVSDRYLSIIKNEPPGKIFSNSELQLITDGSKDKTLDPPMVIQFYTDDHLLLINYKDRDSIVDKIRNLSIVQCIALVEYVERILKEKS